MVSRRIRCVLGAVLCAVAACSDSDAAPPLEPEPEPPREPVCAGCLCLDPAWSCDGATRLAADGGVVGLGPEAGLLEIATRSYELGGIEYHAPARRQWYVFQPADDAPETRPLIVLFNGLDAATSAILYAFNTAGRTLDPALGDSGVADNPHGWTRFANVLWLDTGYAGYSYGVGSVSPATRSIPEEGASALLVVLGFLKRHPSIRSNPVVLAGESWGGIRETTMLWQLLHHGSLATGDNARQFRDSVLHHTIAEHFDVDSAAPSDVPAIRAAEQFGRMIAIQGVVGGYEWGLHAPDEPPPAGCTTSELRCGASPQYYYVMEQVAQKAARPSLMSQMMGVDIETIAWLHAANRADSRHPAAAPYVDEEELVGVFGELGVCDYYYAPQGVGWSGYQCGAGSPVIEVVPEDPAEIGPLGAEFLSLLEHAQVFMTHAALDARVRTERVPEGLLELYPEIISQAVLEMDQPADVDRPGRLRIVFHDSSIGEVIVRAPYYADSGHYVSRDQPGELAADVAAWLEQ